MSAQEMKKEIPYKIYISENDMPKAWYNLRADMKNKPAPLLNPETLEPMSYDDLRPVFCDELIKGRGFFNTVSAPRRSGRFPGWHPP